MSWKDFIISSLLLTSNPESPLKGSLLWRKTWARQSFRDHFHTAHDYFKRLECYSFVHLSAHTCVQETVRCIHYISGITLSVRSGFCLWGHRLIIFSGQCWNLSFYLDSLSLKKILLSSLCIPGQRPTIFLYILFIYLF